MSADIDAPTPAHWHGSPNAIGARAGYAAHTQCTCTALEIYPPSTTTGERLRRERDLQVAAARLEVAIAAGKRAQPVGGHVRSDGREVAPFYRADPVRRRT